jgi:hypothetical protein
MSAELARAVHRTGARTDGIDFVMVGLKRPAGGVRIYATRHMPHLEWGQVQRGYATLWHIDADMDNLLVIDEASYPDALARLFAIWTAQDEHKAATELPPADPPRYRVPLSTADVIGIATPAIRERLGADPGDSQP